MADYFIEVAIPNVGPQGIQGVPGPANEITLGTVTTGDEGSEATAAITGTPPEQTLDLTIPRGDTGLQGTTGNAGPTGAGGVGVVPPEIYADMQAAVEGGITFGGVYRHTSEGVYWVEEPDPDAAAFIASSGATDVWNIQQFVKGVKALGLFDDMVSWPLRSAQNAGSGTTAYSLGGLGTFNGTLVNGPTWGVDGVIFAATNRQINLPDEAALRDTRTVFAAFRPNNDSFNQAIFGIDTLIATGKYADIVFDGQNFAGQTQGFKSSLTRNGSLSTNQNGSRTIGLGTFRSGGYTADDSTDNVFINGALESGGARTGLSALDATGTPTTRRLFGGSSDMIGAFVMSSTATLTNQQFADLTSLYKTTLGLGLGLP